MIILRDVPFERRAKFLYDSICRYPDGPGSSEALGDQAADIATGLQAYHDLLRGIYADVAAVEAKDDQQKYLALVASMALLYAVFAFGTLVDDRGQPCVQIDKVALKRAYKKGSLARRKRHLEGHGFSIRYLSAQGECGSWSRASHLSIAYDPCPDLVPAVKHFAESTESISDGTTKVMYNKLAVFLKGDYEAAILRKPIPRDALDPLRDDLLSTIGEYRHDWEALVNRLRDKCGLSCSGFWTYGGTPSWGVSFAAKRKRPLAIFTLGPDIVFVEFTLPLSAAERIIRERQSYSDRIRQRIESFHCVKCPKECQGSNLTKIDGVWLCSGRAEARRIYTYLQSAQDFASVHSMLDMIC